MKKIDVYDLFTGHDDATGEHIYYEDKEGTKPYNGIAFEIFRGKLCSEFEVKDGYNTGIEKTYYEDTGELQGVFEMERNTVNGIAKEFYKNGKMQCQSIVINNQYINTIYYDEEGNVTEIYEMQPDDMEYSVVKDRIPIYREKYKLI